MKFKICTILTLLFVSINNIKAQDYLISFAGLGASTTVDSVKVENLTKGTSLIMNGSDILHLMGSITGIETVIGNGADKIVFYPNPMNDYSRMKFVLPESGETLIALYDISGRKLVQTQELLLKGEHTYEIQGIMEGIYFTRINSGRYSLSGRLISSGSHNSNLKIIHESSGNTENTLLSQEKQIDIKGTNAEVMMQYDTGDRLKFIGFSDIYSTVLTAIPTTSKTFTYEFIACTDGDVNNYPIVKICNQVWMAENLKTTKYNNGTSIPYVTDNPEWANLATPAYCWWENDLTNKNIYGALYNWYSVATGNLCPNGWHVPTGGDFQELEDYLEDRYGSIFDIVKPLGSTSGWKEWPYEADVIGYNQEENNDTGFSALPGSARMENGKFGDFEVRKVKGRWWSSTEHSHPWAAMRRGLDYNSVNFFWQDYDKRYGFSVRCIKD